ncbi:hypothetical protein C470_08513 [Halorubrum distributum JCM 13561]|uniref:Uncharacterized protein n=1 Tax=Halorubrum distributum JCM 13561 TaxID=1227483 RepID=M0NSH7_9EURY|nr:hypothetical protein [Halorubrum litoreum]EMA60731.1 hypothetical protein C470_08513 [Halorubrum litoreum JCM 13561]
MPANRGLVALVALAVLVWSVAFAGGATVAVLSAGVDVTTTFETPEELSEVNESSGSGFAVATVPVENGTTAVGENGTSAAANGTETVGNTTVPPTEQNATVPPTDENDSTPATNETETDENDSTPATNETETDENDSTPTDQAGDQSSPPNEETVTNESAPAGNATVEGSTAPDANDVDAVAVRHPPDPSRSGQGART